MSAYRTAPEPAPTPTRPLLCRLGWHRWAATMQDVGGGEVAKYVACSGCRKLRCIELPMQWPRVRPRPVSPAFIDGLEAAGARPELVASLRQGAKMPLEPMNRKD